MAGFCNPLRDCGRTCCALLLAALVCGVPDFGPVDVWLAGFAVAGGVLGAGCAGDFGCAGRDRVGIASFPLACKG